MMTAAVAVAVGLIGAPAAKADFTLSLSSTGSATQNIDFTSAPSGTAGGLSWSVNIFGQEVVSGTYAGFVLSIALSTTSPSTSPVGQVTQGDITVDSGTATAPLVIGVSSSGFNAIGTPTYISESISATSMFGGALSAATTTAAGATSGSGTTNAIGTSVDAFIPSNTVAANLVGLITVSDTITVANGGSAPGDTFTFTSDITAAPAPSGLILAATMVPFFGLIRRRLRRETPVVA
jgi:hypothetical protein